jgi:hypothetical protein
MASQSDVSKTQHLTQQLRSMVSQGGSVRRIGQEPASHFSTRQILA